MGQCQAWEAPGVSTGAFCLFPLFPSLWWTMAHDGTEMTGDGVQCLVTGDSQGWVLPIFTKEEPSSPP